MRSILNLPLPSDRLWEFAYFGTAAYLLFHPALAHGVSYAVALGGGLLLLLFRTVPAESIGLLGRAWWFFLLYVLFSSSFSMVPGLTLQSAGFLFLGSLLYILSREGGPKSQGRLEVLLLLTAALAAVLALRQRFYGFENLALRLPNLSGEDLKIATAAAHNQRAFAPLVTPGALGALMILFIPQGFVLALTRTGLKRILFGLLTLLLAAGLWSTQSVGAFASLVLAVLAVLGVRHQKFWTGAAFLAGLAAVGGVLEARGLHSWLWAAFHMRLDLWQSAWRLFEAHPLLGTGLGTFGEAYQRAGFSLETGSRFPHDLILQLLSETGVVGLLLFLAAAVGMARRIKLPSRWEGWGVMTGALAFFLFSFVDLPFQMPELAWVFAGLLGRLEMAHEKPLRLPGLPPVWLEGGLLALLLVAGFLPPYSPWAFLLLGAGLWGLLAFLRQRAEGVPLWVALGGLYLLLRAFCSPSALGATRFLEIAGFALAFFLILPCLPRPRKFFLGFLGLGLAWSLKPWWVSFREGGGSLRQWLAYQYSDHQGFLVFHDPKQVALFLLPLVFFLRVKPRSLRNLLALGWTFLTMLRLKSMAALLGLAAGFFAALKGRSRPALAAAALVLALGLVWLRSRDPSPTRWGRLGIWESAVRVWALNPVIGVGPGAFDGDYHLVQVPRASGVNRYLMDAEVTHNEFLGLLTAFGLIGLGFGAAFLWKAWKREEDGARRPALAALGASAMVDFCFHNPLMALQGAALAADWKHRKSDPSWAGAALAAGLCLGLFGAALGARALERQYRADLSQNRYPEALRCLEYAGRLDAWDARVTVQKAGYLEKLYLATGDPAWKEKADNAFARALRLEKTDGYLRFENARRLTRRLALKPSGADVKAAQEAWRRAEAAMPFNALVRYEEGLFLIRARDGKGALADFQKAVELEPHYAAAWANLGFLLERKGDGAGARSAFRKALEVYGRWKDATRIAPLERELTGLSPDTVKLLRRETAR